MALLACAALLAGATIGRAVCAAEIVEVVIEKDRFIPQRLTAKVGTTVRWVNNEKRSNHSVWFKEQGLPDSGRFFPGESWQRTFDQPGVYPYVCEPHPEMNGVIEVVP